jgi:heme oxygenase
MSSARPAATCSLRLQAATRQVHEQLDRHIMACNPFGSFENYRRFLVAQYHFHSDVDGLYAVPGLAALLPGLRERRRLARIGYDLLDLGHPLPVPDAAGRVAAGGDTAAALGWLYVAELSNLGAGGLFRLAEHLGLNERFGASHLAAHPSGRAAHWRRFTTALDGLKWSPAQELRAAHAACAAFQRMQAHVEAAFAA